MWTNRKYIENFNRKSISRNTTNRQPLDRTHIESYNQNYFNTIQRLKMRCVT